MSTAADILGLSRESGVPPRWRNHYQRLCAERDRLLGRDFSTSEPTSVKLDDLTEAATEEAERSITLVESQATQGTLVEILEAIRRIELGTYGICEASGRPIEPERLEATPWVRYCFTEQAEMERNGLAMRPAIPSLQTAFDEGAAPPSDGAEADVEENAA